MLVRTWNLVLLAALLLVGSATHAQVLPHRPVTDRLPNGLTVVTVPFDSPGIVAYYTLVRTGSRDEVEPGHSGFAHLFEHMMFRGTRTMSATEYEHRMQALGADNNAYTTEDFTLYTVTLPASSLEQLVPIEAERFQRLWYTEPVFQTEARAVLGEYNKNAASPLIQMWEVLSEMAFTRHTYGHTTLGYLADIQAMPGYYNYSLRFFRRFYTPDNTAIVVAGDVQRERLLDLIRRHYGRWTGRRDTPRIPTEPEQRGPRSQSLAWVGTSPPRMLIGYRVPAFSVDTVDTAALEVVHALAFSESSDLYQRLVVQERKLLGLESWKGDFHRDPHLFVIEAKLAPETSFEEIERAITEELARIGRGEYPRERIEAVVSHLRYSLAMELQTASDVANTVAMFMAMTGDANTLERYHAQLARVTPDDVARVARTYLVPERRNTVTLIEAERAPAGSVRVGPGIVRPRRQSSVTTPASPGPRESVSEQPAATPRR